MLKKHKIIIQTYIGLVVAVSMVFVMFGLMNKSSGPGLNPVKVDLPDNIANEIFSFDTGYAEHYAIGFNGQSLYLLADDKLIAFDDEFRAEIVLDLRADRQRRAFAFDEKNNIYLGSDIIEIIQGESKIELAALADSIITAIAVSADYIYAADAGNRCVLRYERYGLDSDSRPGIWQRGFDIKSPYFDLEFFVDRVVVADPGRHNIRVYDEMGCLLEKWGFGASCFEGFFGCCNPANFAIMSNGDFVTVEKGRVRVKLYDSQGKYIGMIASEAEFQQHLLSIKQKDIVANQIALDVAVDKADNIYIMESATSKIRVFRLQER